MLLEGHARSGTNRVTIVDNGFVNQDAARVVGTDFEIGYTMQLDGGGTLSARVLATWLNENSTTALGAAKRDVAGETGDGSLPEFKSTTYLRYTKGPFSLFAQERFIGSGSLDFDDIEGVTIDDNSVDSRYYTDIGLTWGPEGANLELGAVLQCAEPVRQGSAGGGLVRAVQRHAHHERPAVRLLRPSLRRRRRSELLKSGS